MKNTFTGTICTASHTVTTLPIEYGDKTITIGDSIYPSKMYMLAINQDGLATRAFLDEELKKVYGDEISTSGAFNFNAKLFLMWRLQKLLYE